VASGTVRLAIIVIRVTVGTIPITMIFIEHKPGNSMSEIFLVPTANSVLKWLRAPGDTNFALGILIFVLFIFGFATKHSLKKKN
jgi:nitric oxide reductase large subunit